MCTSSKQLNDAATLTQVSGGAWAIGGDNLRNSRTVRRWRSNRYYLGFNPRADRNIFKLGVWRQRWTWHTVVAPEQAKTPANVWHRSLISALKRNAKAVKMQIEFRL